MTHPCILQARLDPILSQTGPVPIDKVPKNQLKSIPKIDLILLVWFGIFYPKPVLFSQITFPKISSNLSPRQTGYHSGRAHTSSFLGHFPGVKWELWEAKEMDFDPQLSMELEKLC